VTPAAVMPDTDNRSGRSIVQILDGVTLASAWSRAPATLRAGSYRRCCRGIRSRGSSRLVATMLFGLSPTDPLTHGTRSLTTSSVESAESAHCFRLKPDATG
jgi:hypothetical protein